MLRATGECVRITRRPWAMDGRSGETVTARVLVGRADFVDVKIPDGVRVPGEGEILDLAVAVLPKARGGFDIKAVGAWDQIVSTKPVTKSA